eukprot:1155761-Prymnesium_polylepis.1
MVLEVPLGGVGQVVTCVDMIRLVYDTRIQIKEPDKKNDNIEYWYCNGHGEMGVVVGYENKNGKYSYDVCLFITVPEDVVKEMERRLEDAKVARQTALDDPTTPEAQMDILRDDLSKKKRALEENVTKDGHLLLTGVPATNIWPL